MSSNDTHDVKIWNMLLEARIPYSTEAEMQGAIETLLVQRGAEFHREFWLSKKDRVDFMIGGIAVECKVKGNAMAIYRQVQRYANYECVTGIVLFTSFHMALPPLINNKYAMVIKPGKAWL